MLLVMCWPQKLLHSNSQNSALNVKLSVDLEQQLLTGGLKLLLFRKLKTITLIAISLMCNLSVDILKDWLGIESIVHNYYQRK